MTKDNTFNIICPCCDAQLVVDSSNGQVLENKTAHKKPQIDLSKIKDKLNEEARLRENSFQKSLESERNKSEIIKKKFNDALKKAKDSPGKKPPVRDIDL